MQKNKLIDLMKSFAFIPLLTITAPVSGFVSNPVVVPSKIELIEKLKNAVDSRGEANPSPEEFMAEMIINKKAEAIDAFFKKRGAPLYGMGMKMVLEAEENGLDWRLLPSLAIVESNAGKEACKMVTYSYFGYGSCKINFDSKEHGIEVVAESLGGKNPRTAKYYKGKKLDEKLKIYNSVIPTYTAKVYKVMDMIGPEEVTFNLALNI